MSCQATGPKANSEQQKVFFTIITDRFFEFSSVLQAWLGTDSEFSSLITRFGARQDIWQRSHFSRNSRLPWCWCSEPATVKILVCVSFFYVENYLLGRGCSIERNVYSNFENDKASLETEKTKGPLWGIS